MQVEEQCPTCGNNMAMYYKPTCFHCSKPEPVQYHMLIPACYYVAVKNGLPYRTIWNSFEEYQRKTKNYFFERNDSTCYLPDPDDEYQQDDDGNFEKIVPYLRMVNEEYPIATTTFFISW